MRQFDYSELATRLWDSEIVSLVAKIHECKGRQDLYVRQKPAKLNRMVEIARVQSTEASNRIEGIVTTDTRIKQLVEDRTTPRNRNESEILGYRDVLNTIHESYEYIPLSPSTILQLHRDMLRPAGLSYGGSFKNTQNSIVERLPDGSKRVQFMPCAPYETPDAVESICASYRQTLANETVDPLLLIPAFILDFLCIHPFNDGNGRMSRLLTLLLMYRSGYQVGKYVSIEKQIEKSKDRYYDAIALADENWHEGTNDPTPFIRYMLQVILAGYIEFEDRVGMMNDTGVKSSPYDMVKAYASGKLGPFSGVEAVTACPTISRSAVLAAVKQLVEEGFLLRLGNGKKTRYVRQMGDE